MTDAFGKELRSLCTESQLPTFCHVTGALEVFQLPLINSCTCAVTCDPADIATQSPSFRRVEPGSPSPGVVDTVDAVDVVAVTGAGAGLAIATPLSQINFFPDLMQVNFFVAVEFVKPAFAQAAPADGEAADT
jgi:hypothetical protein